MGTARRKSREENLQFRIPTANETWISSLIGKFASSLVSEWKCSWSSRSVFSYRQMIRVGMFSNVQVVKAHVFYL
jgi:hypothetical protein